MRHRVFKELGVLLMTSAAARLLGMLYRVLLARTIGSESLGFFQMAFPVYLVALTLASLGLPVAVAQLVAAAVARGDHRSALAVRRRAAWMGGAASVAAAAALLAAAPRIADGILHEPHAAPALALLAWALPPTVLAGIHRGYWQGMRRMDRVGLSHVCEAGSRCVALACLLAILPAGSLTVEGGIVLAAALGLLGELADLGAVLAHRGSPRPPAGRDGRRDAASPCVPDAPPSRGSGSGVPDSAWGLLRLSVPVAVARTSGTFGLALDAALIPAGLIAHAGMDGAAALFGQLSGMALPIVTLPTVALHPIDTIVVPAVAQAAAVGDRRAVASRAGASALAAALLAALTSVALYCFARPIAAGVYGLPELAGLLRLCAAVPPGLFLAQTGNSVLNGVGRTGAALACQMCGTAVRIALLVALVPRLGISGAVAAIATGAAVNAAASWGSIAASLVSFRGRR